MDEEAVTSSPDLEEVETLTPQRKVLPTDLPLSLDDRKAPRGYDDETEFYDAWQGGLQYLKNPIPAPQSPLAFNLNISHEEEEDNGFSPQAHGPAEDNDGRLMKMLAAQAAHRDGELPDADVNTVVGDPKLEEAEKKAILQKALHMAASNGDIERLKKLLEEGKAKSYLNVDAPDEEGAAPLIYASCFGHHEVVSTLLIAKANVDCRDRNQWTPLMWALTNRHKNIAKTLLDHGASPEVKTSSGRRALDFAAPNSEIADYLHDNGYHIGDAGVRGDFYDAGFSQDRFEQEMEEQEMRRRMQMESSVNLEVDLASLGLDERPETPEELDDHQDFVWDRCLHDQMFVFQESDLDQILDIVVTNMTPQRSASQKPVPANVVFLAARYAHYHATPGLLGELLTRAMDRINVKVEEHQWDMTVLAFWISNATLLLHYLRKDPGVQEVSTHFQIQLAELIHEIFILIIRDAERRIDKILDTAMLDHETIPGMEDIQFANEWNIFRKQTKVQAPDMVGSSRASMLNTKSQGMTPRNITSLLSSTLFVLDLYDIHSVLTAQIVSQLYYWIGAELFNHVLGRKAYLARTKAMQIRMNISTLEEWVQANSRVPQHYENGALSTSAESTEHAARRHLTPINQLLQWVQIFSSMGDDPAELDKLLQSLPRLSPKQLLHACNSYRFERGEPGLPKAAKKRLQAMQVEAQKRKEQSRRERVAGNPSRMRSGTVSSGRSATAQTPNGNNNGSVTHSSNLDTSASGHDDDGDEDDGDQPLINPSHMLPFDLPTNVDMRLSYGAGMGGMNRERERKYTPSLPADFLARLDTSTGNRGGEKSTANGWDQRL